MMLATQVTAIDLPLRWRWSNPNPHGGNIVDMAYSQARGLGVQVAERGQIYTSDDLSLWLPRDSFTTEALRAVTFFGPSQRIVITGESGTVLYADDVNHFQPGTLLDGPTSDWLEAVCASTDLLVAAGDSGAVYTSVNGVSWSRQNSGSSTWFRGAAHGDGTFVIVGENGEIRTSPNGTNWTLRSTPTSHHLNRVHYGGGQFTVVGNAGVTLISTNAGISWFPEASGATHTLQYATLGGVDRLLDGDHEVWIKDGLDWSDEIAKSNGPPAWSYYSAIGRSNYFLIGGHTGLQSEGYQTAAAPYFWLTPNANVRSWLWDILRVPSLYVSVGDFGTVLTSGNGVDWTLELVPASITNNVLLGIGGNANLLLAVGDSGSIMYSPNILTNIVVTNGSTIVTQTVSTLGVLWRAETRFTTEDLQGVATLGNSLFVVSGAQGSVFTSPDGMDWTPRTTPTVKLLTSIAEWPGGLVAVGDDGALITSPDGMKWTNRTSGTTNWLYRVRWLNDTLLAVGQNGTILTSTDSINWTPRASGTTAWLSDAAFIEDTWFVIGTSGTVLTSTNLSQWIAQGTITKKALYGAAEHDGQLVVVGVEGVILRSPVVPDLTPVSFLDYDRSSTSNASYSLFLFGGKPDQRFTLDRATNLTQSTWAEPVELEIFDGSGTLYYLETLTGTNQPPTEYYRTTLDLTR